MTTAINNTPVAIKKLTVAEREAALDVLNHEIRAFVKTVGDTFSGDAEIAEHVRKIIVCIDAYADEIPASLKEASVMRILEVGLIKVPTALLMKALRVVSALFCRAKVLAGCAGRAIANAFIWLRNGIAHCINKCGGDCKVVDYYEVCPKVDADETDETVEVRAA
jgi:hypothetical protein